MEMLAFDRASVREIDANGFMHVKISPLTREQVAPYNGCEIPDWRERGLDPKKTYYGYRPAEELSKEATIKSTNGIPIQLRHHADYADAPAKETRIGQTGTDGEWKPPFLMNSLHILDKQAQNLIESNAMRELSLAYKYDPDFTSGETPSGEHYDFVMRNIIANHVALVEEGRAGKEVLVYDQKQPSISIDNSREESEKMENKKEQGMDENPAVERTEVALAQAIIDLHKKGAEGNVADPVTEDEGDDKGERIEAIIADVIKKGLPEDQADALREALTDLANDEEQEEIVDEEVAEDEDDDEEDKTLLVDLEKEGDDIDDDEVAEDEDDKDDDELTKAVSDMGLDADDPVVKNAFAEGMKYAKGKKGDKDDVDAEDEDEDDRDMIAGELANIAEDRAYRRMKSEFIAAERVRPVLGKVKIGAFDSAAGYYRAALKRLGVGNVNAIKNPREAYDMFMAGRQRATARKLAQDSAPKATAGKISEILSKIN